MSASEVVVIDYGMGNLLSVRRSLEYCGASVIVTSDPEIILDATHVVLPGVGAFPSAMEALHKMNLVETINVSVNNGSIFLGICLGMQLLFSVSEEFAITAGLDLIPGRVVSIPQEYFGKKLKKIPHIGWSELNRANSRETWDDTLLAGVKPGMATYFIHSFMVQPNNPQHCVADCLYGNQLIHAVVSHNNITGCQFHPEKSGAIGMKILQNFLNS